MSDGEARRHLRSIFRLAREYGPRLPCAYCGVRLTRHEATADHVVPKSVGGASAFENIAVACKHCNGAKASHSADDFRAWLTTDEGRAWRASRHPTCPVVRVPDAADQKWPSPGAEVWFDW